MYKKWFFRNLIEIVIYIVLIFFCMFTVKTFLFYNVKVDGSSMDYSLKSGEVGIVTKISSIERFDIVVFNPPTANDKLYVKRVIGLPGDTIEYRNDILLVNGEEIEEIYLNEKKQEFYDIFTKDFTLESLTGVEVVPEGKVFVLGDNRINSVDSRKFGFIEIEAVDELKLILWPISDLRILP